MSELNSDKLTWPERIYLGTVYIVLILIVVGVLWWFFGGRGKCITGGQNSHVVHCSDELRTCSVNGRLVYCRAP